MLNKAVLTANNLITIALCALVFFLPICNAGIEICIYFSFAVFIFKKLLERDFKIIKDPSLFFLVIYVLFCALSMVHSGPLMHISLNAFYSKWLKGLFLVIIIIDNLKAPNRFKCVLSFLLILAALVAVDVYSQRYFGCEFFRGKSMLRISGGMWASTGPFIHYNNLATYLIVVLPLWITLSLRQDIEKMSRSIFIFFGSLTVIALVMTFSRGAWLGFIFEIILIMFLTRSIRKIWPFLLIFTVLLLLIPLFRHRFQYIFQIGGDSQRLAVWAGAWAMIKEHPFLGKGLGTFMSYFPHYTKDLGVRFAHNCYLQIWAESGIFALLSFVSFIASILYRGIQAFQKDPNYILLGLISALLGFSVHSFFDTQLYSLQLVTLFWVICGLSLSFLINI